MKAADTGRIAALDHIRGLSILGILAVNAIGFAQPPEVYADPAQSVLPLSHADIVSWWVTETFFHGKFITLFNLLFGISLYLVGRDDRPDRPLNRRPLFRRLAWLVLFGLIHGALVWYGDILLQYALVGFVFWRWRGETARRLLTIGGMLFVGGAVILLFQWFLPEPMDLPKPLDVTERIVVMRGDFLSSLAGNVTLWARGVPGDLIGYFPTTLGLMMLGLGLFKTGVLSGQARMRIYLAMLIAGAVSLVLIGWQSCVTLAQGFPVPRMYGAYAIANTVLCLPVALGYASGLILLGRLQLGKLLLHPLACAGRMAFTNYICQSLIMTSLFYGGRLPHVFGLPWYGEMNHAALWPIVVTIWIGQLVFSTLWLQWFRYGPLEWVWRCLTYDKRLELRK
ncbi:MAG: DUF418 domain-containing protein [Asticcacaulis sp.]